MTEEIKYCEECSAQMVFENEDWRCLFCVPVPVAENQLGLFARKEVPTTWEKEWKEMPEFVQEKKSPIQTVVVSFYAREEVEEFAKMIGQQVTPNTRSVRFKRINLGKPSDFIYD